MTPLRYRITAIGCRATAGAFIGLLAGKLVINATDVSGLGIAVGALLAAVLVQLPGWLPVPEREELVRVSEPPRNRR